MALSPERALQINEEAFCHRCTCGMAWNSMSQPFGIEGLFRPFKADRLRSSTPRALPWAALFRPLRGRNGYSPPHNRPNVPLRGACIGPGRASRGTSGSLWGNAAGPQAADHGRKLVDLSAGLGTQTTHQLHDLVTVSVHGVNSPPMARWTSTRPSSN